MRVTSIAVVPVLVSITLGCGDGGGSPDGGGPAIDATRADAARDDGATPDADVTGAIIVAVVTDTGDVDGTGAVLPVGVPSEGTRVYFLEPDGTTHLVTTGADGIATSPPVRAGTTALVVRAQIDQGYGLAAFAALAPGTSLTAGPSAPVTFGANLLDPMTITAPAMPPATNYSLRGPCIYAQFGGPSYQVFLRDGCDWTDRTVVALATNFSGLLGYTSAQVDLAVGANIALDPFVPPATFVGDLHAIPSGVSNAYVYGRYREAGGDWLSQFYLASAASPDLELEAAVAPVGASLALVSNLYSIEADTLPNGLTRIVAGAPTTASFDLTNLLPFITAPIWQAASTSAHWLEYAPIRTADLAVVAGRYTVAATTTPVTFRLIGPHAGTSLALPALPPELAALAPAPADPVTILEAFIVDDPAAADYLAAVPAADARSRLLFIGMYGEAPEAWISGGLTQPEK